MSGDLIQVKIAYQILTALSFGGLLLYVYNKKKKANIKFDQTIFIYATWLVASLLGIVYIKSDLVNIGKGVPSLFSVFIAVFLFYLYVWPINYLSERNNNNYTYNNNWFVSFLCYFVCIIVILPFAENLIHLSDGNTREDIGYLHDDADLFTNYHSSLGKTLSNILRLFKFVLPALFFNYINVNNKNINTAVVVGLLCALFCDSLEGFCKGARYLAVIDGLQFVFLYLLMRKTISPRIKPLINRGLTVLVCIIVFIFVIISITRFGDSNKESLIESYCRYAGEGFNNLYSDMMYIDKHTYGLHTFRAIFGDENTPDFLTMYMGIRMFVYYTFMGDFVADFGIVGAMGIFLVVSLIIYRNVIKKESLGFGNLVALGVYSSVFTSGFMYTSLMNFGLGIKGLLGFVIIYSFIRYGSRNK